MTRKRFVKLMRGVGFKPEYTAFIVKMIQASNYPQFSSLGALNYQWMWDEAKKSIDKAESDLAGLLGKEIEDDKLRMD